MSTISNDTKTVMNPDSRQEFLDRQPTYWMKRAYQALRRTVDTELRPLGITLSQRDALLSLHHLGPASHGQLADRLGLEQSSVSRLVEGLVRRGLLTAREDDLDRRSRVLTLTEEGSDMLAQTPGSSRIAGRLLAEALSKSERDQLIELLRRVTEALEVKIEAGQ